MQKKLAKYEFICVNVAYRAESNKLTKLYPEMQGNHDIKVRDEFATAGIRKMVDYWVAKGKSPTRKNVAVALHLMLDGQEAESSFVDTRPLDNYHLIFGSEKRLKP